MTIQEMFTFVRTILGDNNTTKYSEDDEIILFLNEAALLVASKTLSLQTFSEGPTAVGDDRYPLPQDYLSLKDVQIIDGDNRYQLVRLTYDDYETSYGQGTHSGRPRHFKIELGATSTSPGSAPGDIWVKPTPDTTSYLLRISYFQRTSFLTAADMDKSYELKQPFHRAVCYHAAMELAFKLDDNSRAQKFKGLFDQAMIDAFELMGRSDRSEPHGFARSYNPGKAGWRRRR